MPTQCHQRGENVAELITFSANADETKNIFNAGF